MIVTNRLLIVFAILTIFLSAALPAACAGTGGGGLENLYRVTDGVFDSHVEYHQLNIPSGHEAMLADLKGPGKITYFYITDDASGGHFYPGLVLKIFWDGSPSPAVNAPLGDFFGALGDKTIDYQSAPMQINHRSFVCCLPMPFAKSAVCPGERWRQGLLAERRVRNRLRKGRGVRVGGEPASLRVAAQ